MYVVTSPILGKCLASAVSGEKKILQWKRCFSSFCGARFFRNEISSTSSDWFWALNRKGSKIPSSQYDGTINPRQSFTCFELETTKENNPSQLSYTISSSQSNPEKSGVIVFHPHSSKFEQPLREKPLGAVQTSWKKVLPVTFANILAALA